MLGDLLDSSALSRQLGNGSQVSLQLEHLSCNEHPCECCFARREQPSTSSTTVVPSPASRWSGQSSQALRRASSSQKLPLGRAGSSPQSPCELTLPAQDFHHCYGAVPCSSSPPPQCLQWKHSHPQVGSAPAPGALVQAGSHLGPPVTKFWSHSLQIALFGGQAHIQGSATQLFSRKTGQDLAPSTSAVFLGLLTPPFSLHSVAQ